MEIMKLEHSNLRASEWFFIFVYFLFNLNFIIFVFFSYQYGPDTYLLQLRDTDFPVRLREYMKIAAGRSPSYIHNLVETKYDWSVSSFYYFI